MYAIVVAQDMRDKNFDVGLLGDVADKMVSIGLVNHIYVSAQGTKLIGNAATYTVSTASNYHYAVVECIMHSISR